MSNLFQSNTVASPSVDFDLESVFIDSEEASRLLDVTTSTFKNRIKEHTSASKAAAPSSSSSSATCWRCAAGSPNKIAAAGGTPRPDPHAKTPPPPRQRGRRVCFPGLPPKERSKPVTTVATSRPQSRGRVADPVGPAGCLTAALAYAARGWAVLPLHAVDAAGRCTCGKTDCSSPAKHPRTPSGLKGASTDAETVRAWWLRWPSANAGLVTGEASGFVVLDVDGEEGMASLEALLNENGHLPQTPEAVTGGGGRHVLFRYPFGGVRNSAGKVGENLDVRGDGGYVVAAPSLHASGNRYEWLDGCWPEDTALSEVPGWLLGLMRSSGTSKATPPRMRLVQDDAGEVGLHWLGKTLARCGEGNRNDTGFWLAAQLRDAGLSQGEAEPFMLDYADRVPGGGTPRAKQRLL